jgi:hypothetical protein
MENRKSKRSLRLALVLGAAVAGTALVGWGGLAAWQAYTQNAGNAFTTGSIGHTNLVAGSGNTACTSTSAEATICDVIVSGSGLDYNWTGISNTVTITDTGSLPSNFALSTPTDPSGGLCPYLTLAVTGSGSDHSSYVTQSGIGPISTTALMTSADASTWNQGDSNTFNFAVGVTAGYSAPDSGAVGQSCTFSVLFTQAA